MGLFIDFRRKQIRFELQIQNSKVDKIKNELKKFRRVILNWGRLGGAQSAIWRLGGAHLKADSSEISPIRFIVFSLSIPFPTTSIETNNVTFNLQLLDLNSKDLFPGKFTQDTQSSIIQIQKIDK